MKRPTDGYKKRVKLPWFPFYPHDWENSETVILLNMVQRGLFFMLLCLQWMNGDLPNDLDDLASLVEHYSKDRPSHSDLQIVIGKAFVADKKTGRLYNRRLAHEENVQRARLKYDADRKRVSRKRPTDIRVTSDGPPYKEKEKDKEKDKERDKEKEVTTKTIVSVFDDAWSTYPKRKPSNNRSAALRAFTARVRSGVSVADLLAGARRYAAYCRAAGIEGGPYVKQGVTFFGPDRHWEDAWDVPPPNAVRGAVVVPKVPVAPGATDYAALLATAGPRWNTGRGDEVPI